MMLKRLLPLLLASALLMLLPAAAVLADPPPWAPAHGYREKEKHKEKDKEWEKHRRDVERGDRDHVVLPTPVVTLPDFYALPAVQAGRCDRSLVGRNLGTLLGALAGGATGSQFGKGDGKVAATIGGVLLGAILGNEIQRRMDGPDQGCLAQALEKAPTGQDIAWTNPDTGVDYRVQPTRTFTSATGQPCRDYASRVTIAGRVETLTGSACRQPDGTWHLVN